MVGGERRRRRAAAARPALGLSACETSDHRHRLRAARRIATADVGCCRSPRSASSPSPPAATATRPRRAARTCGRSRRSRRTSSCSRPIRPIRAGHLPCHDHRADDLRDRVGRDRGARQLQQQPGDERHRHRRTRRLPSRRRTRAHLLLPGPRDRPPTARCTAPRHGHLHDPGAGHGRGTPPTPSTRGSNLALEATVVEVSSEFNDSFAATNAIDDSGTTEWSSAGDGDDAFITLDLGDEHARSPASSSSPDRCSTARRSPRPSPSRSTTATTFGPFPAGTPVESELRRVSTTTGRTFRFDVDTSTGGNVGAVEVRLFAP